MKIRICTAALHFSVLSLVEFCDEGIVVYINSTLDDKTADLFCEMEISYLKSAYLTGIIPVIVDERQ